MIHDDERTKELFAWAVRFSSMQLPAEDVRYPIRALVARIVEHIRQQPDLSFASDAQVRKLVADRADMLTQLDILQAKAVAVTATAKFEQLEARHTAGPKKAGKITAEKNKAKAADNKTKVLDAANSLAANVNKKDRVSKVMKKTGLSRTTVQKYLK